MPATLEATPTLRVHYPTDGDAPSAFRAAFDFLQRHGEGRYSDRTLMSINRWAERSHALQNGGGDPYERFPGVHILSTEISYDEVTEVKSGGVAGIAVTLPTEEGGSRLVLAVAPESRRKGLGKQLLDSAKNYEGMSVHAWVGQHNVDGQKFLLSMGMYPQEMNNSRAVLFGYRARNSEQDGVAT